jgi:hypothetical protein
MVSGHGGRARRGRFGGGRGRRVAVAVGAGVCVGTGVAVGVGVGVALAPGVRVASGVGVSFPCFPSSVPPPRSRSRLPKNVVGLLVLPTFSPAISSEAVTNVTASTKASAPVARPIFHWRGVSRKPREDWTVRCVVVCGSASRSSGGGGASGSKSRSSTCGTGTARREAATVFTVSVGRFRPSETRATMTGVIAAANTVPGFQRSGMMNAAAALEAPAISSVGRDRPDWRGSADTLLHASEMVLAPRRGTCRAGGRAG